MGSGVSHYFENLAGDSLTAEECKEFEMALNKMDAAGVPLCLSYPGNFLKGDNWFMPNRKALEGWLIAAGFKVGSVSGLPNTWGVLNLSGWAERLDIQSVKEHGLVGKTGGYSSDLKI